MLRNRSRVVTKQALMADQTSTTTTTQNHSGSKASSFLASPRFKAFTQKKACFFSEADPLVSPTSILDSKPFFSLTSPFSHAKTALGNHKHREKPERPKGISLVLNEEEEEEERPRNDQSQAQRSFNGRKVVLGTSKLRVQIPRPTEFGIKTNRNPHVSSSGARELCSPVAMAAVDQRSEDYTCVISHAGPVPRTTHIFEDCVVDQTFCCFLDIDSDNNNNNNNNNNNTKKPKRSSDFLSFCHTCNKNLHQNIDIYIYRGEKGFCSRECRHQEMLLDGMGNEEFDDHSIRDCF